MRTNLAVTTASFALSLLLLAVPGTGRADNLFVANEGNNTIEEYNPSGVPTLFANSNSGLNYPSGLAFDSAGNLYVANVGNGTVEEFKSSGGALSDTGTVVVSGIENGPIGLAIDSSGNLYVSTNNNEGPDNWTVTIRSFGPSGRPFSGSNYNGSQDINGLACDSAGNLYASFVSVPNDYVEKFINDDNTITQFGPQLAYPWGLAFDNSNNLYVSAQNGNKIEKITPSGVGTVFVSGLNSPQGLAIDSANNVYVEEGGTIEEFNPSGVGTAFTSTGLSGTGWLAFQPVPEPSTLVLLAVGLIALLPFRRRRSQK
ncbi:MAG: PEP-CTERM sorting domain-containing protein [Verrucomicrobiia bacterium]